MNKINRMFAFIASTTEIDQKTEFGKALIQQIQAYAFQNLCKNNSNFKQLFEQAVRNNTPYSVEIGLAKSTKEYADVFMQLLIKNLMINEADINHKIKNQNFIFAGNAKNPIDGRSIDWCFQVFFEM